MATEGVGHVTPDMAAQAMAPATSRAAQAIYNDFHHNQLAFEQYLATTTTATHSQFSSLKLTSDAQLCPRHVAHIRTPSKNPECPLGNRCPFRHESPGPMNFTEARVFRDPAKRTVCKHWLRGLCKKGDSCDYLHEYDLRRMPECRFFATFGYCNSGDECLYLHVAPKAKIRECENYNRGFCLKGPACPKKHVRRTACPRYIAGFCPWGPDCRMGHIKATPPSTASRSNSPVQTHKPLTADEAFGPRDRGAAMQGLEVNRRPMEMNNVNTMQGNPYDMNSNNNAGGMGGRRRDMKTVLCFKCGETGHFANMCHNPNRPGNRGGVERGVGGRERAGGGQWSRQY